jgi:hypothetical protein
MCYEVILTASTILSRDHLDFVVLIIHTIFSFNLLSGFP